MGESEFNTFCKSLPHATHVVQWGGAHVWKVGGKVFVIGGLGREGVKNGISFKCSPLSFEMLKEMPGCRPAPYLASRGMKWIQWTSPETLDNAGLKEYVAASYRLVADGLPKKMRAQLGLDEAALTKISTDATLATKSRAPRKSKAPRGKS